MNCLQSQKNRTETHVHRHECPKLAISRERDAAALETAPLGSGRRGRWFESCRPDITYRTKLHHPGDGFVRAVFSGSIASLVTGFGRWAPATRRGALIVVRRVG